MTDGGTRSLLRRQDFERRWLAFVVDGTTHGVRDEVVASWRRARALVSPAATAAPAARSPVDRVALTESARVLEHEFSGLIEDSGLIACLADETGRIVWTSGDVRLLRTAEQANFAPGALWDEASMGINGISLAMATGAPATVWSAEHWLETLHEWSCHAAPIRDPRTGRAHGVLNLATPWDKGNPLVSTAVVALADRLAAELALRLRPALIPPSEAVELTVLGSRRVMTGSRECVIGKRQTEILLILALRPGGVDLEELHADLYGDAAVGTATVKAEVCHLRRALGGRISRAPYRVQGEISVDALQLVDEVKAGRFRSAAARYAGPLLPWSESPRILQFARTVEVALRQAALGTTDVETVLQIAARMDHDVQLVEHALSILPPGDGRRYVMQGHLADIA
jgi:hypothetical protein